MNHSSPFLQRLLHRCIPVVALLSMALSAHAHNVLVLWDDDDNTVSNRPPLASELDPRTQALVAAFEAEGMSVRFSNRTQGLYNANAPSPIGFDAVVHLNGNEDVFNVMPASSVVNLVNYVQNLGGGFITSENTQLQLDLPLGLGLTQAANDLSLITRSGGRPMQPMTVSKLPAQAGHPLLQGLPDSFTFEATRLSGGTVKQFSGDPALALMNDELGSVALAVREYGLGRIVSMHHGGNFSGGTALEDPNVQHMYINAIRWADQRPPTVAEITRVNSATVGADGVVYRVLFDEGVTGVDGSDFSANLSGDLGFSGNFSVTALSHREYEVQANGLTGSGQFTLTLADNGTIRDRSFNANPLAGAPVEGPSYTVDAVPPRLLAIITPQPILPLGSRPALSFIFSEPMNLGLSPSIFLETVSNGIITITAEDDLGPAAASRVQDGLLALYTFQEGGGAVVRDQSKVAPLMNLTIANPGAVTWLSGALRFDQETIVQSDGPAAKLNAALPASNALTVEAWVRPVNLTQTGPARIATVSVTTGSRNMTLSQDTSRYEMRLRRTTTDDNAIPLLATAPGTAQTGLQHVVYTRDTGGTGRLFVDGAERISDSLGGDLSNWDDSYAFALGNEFTENRGWLGEMFLVAVYDRALSNAEILQNRSAGPISDSLGDGRWINPITWQGTLDRSIVQADNGLATASVSEAADLVNNVMAPENSFTVNIISSSLTIDEQPPSYQFAAAGSRVQFRVNVSGAAGSVNYQWSRDVTGNGAYVTVGGNNPTFTIQHVDFDDTGFYRCTVSDVQAVVQTTPAFLEVVAQVPALSYFWLMLTALAVAFAGAVAFRPGRWRRSP